MRDNVRRYVDSLEKTIQNNHQYLKEIVEDFRKMCLMVTPEKNIPSAIMSDIRETYKEIRNRLTEIKAIEQLLKGKYRGFFRNDPLRDKEIMEFGFITKNCYIKFEYTLMQKQAQERAKTTVKEKARGADPKGVPFHWFRSKENQVTSIKNLRILSDLNYEAPSHLEIGERREVSGNRPRALTFFVFSGDIKSIEDLHSKIRLREHDIIERYASDELHGLLTHLREIDPLEVEKIFKELLERGNFLKLKCLLFSIHSYKDLEEDILGLVKTKLEEMGEGEVRTLSI